jgi:2-keto-4-pentenoate hydratase
MQVERGMRAQLERRSELLLGGAQPIGWKVGFNVPAIRERLGLDGPVVGFLSDAGSIADGEIFPLAGAEAVVEPEVAVELGADVTGGASAEEAGAAIAALLPALEIAAPLDLSLPLEEILAGNVFHRAVAFGPRVSVDAPGAGILRVNGEERARMSARSTSAHIVAMVAAVAQRLADVGLSLRAGERVITGVLAQPPAVVPGDRVQLELDALGGVEIGFS